MADHINFWKLLRKFTQFATVLGVMLFGVLSVSPLQAQIHGIPPSVTSIPNHVPPYLPNATASVTSLGPYGYCCQRPSNIPFRNQAFPNRYNRPGRGYGGYGYGYTIPYYYAYPYDDAGYDGSGGGGPYLYSGPPQAQAPPADQTLHVIVDSAPQKVAPRDEIVDPQPERPSSAAIPDAKPGEPTVLVFRDGHKQEVTNYAIMGQTVYIFDSRTKKIALADLDVPATIKANDDQGVEFQVPKAKQSSKPAKGGVPLQSAPDESPKTSSSMTSLP